MQLNLLTADILHSRHLTTKNTFSATETKQQSNSHNKSSVQRILYSKHLFITGSIFRFQFILRSRTDFSIADTLNNGSYKTFLVRYLYTFYILCFTVSSKFSSILVIIFFASLMVLSDPFTSMVDVLPRCSKDVQNAMELRQKHG